MQVSIDPATNGGVFMGGPPYDVENRLVTQGNASYTYDPQNKRVAKVDVPTGNKEYYFYGVGGGEVAAVVWPVGADGGRHWSHVPAPEVYVGGKLPGWIGDEVAR